MKPNTAAYLLVTLAVSSISLVSGQTFPSDVSQQCQQGAAGIFLSNSCLPSQALLGLFTGTTTADQIPTVIGSICSQTPCDDSAISTAVSALTAACKQELASNETAIITLDGALSYYTPLIKGICAKNSTGGYCGIESFPVFFSLLNQTANINSTLASVPCTSCTTNLIAGFANYTPSTPPPQAVVDHGKLVGQLVQAQCGNSSSSNTTSTSSSNPSSTPKSSAPVSSHPNGIYYVLSAVLFIFSVVVL